MTHGKGGVEKAHFCWGFLSFEVWRNCSQSVGDKASKFIILRIGNLSTNVDLVIHYTVSISHMQEVASHEEWSEKDTGVGLRKCFSRCDSKIIYNRAVLCVCQ